MAQLAVEPDLDKKQLDTKLEPHISSKTDSRRLENYLGYGTEVIYSSSAQDYDPRNKKMQQEQERCAASDCGRTNQHCVGEFFSHTNEACFTMSSTLF